MSAVQEEIDSGRLKALEELFNELRNMFGSDFDKSLAKDGYIELESEDDDDEVFFTREKALDFFDTRYSNFINKKFDYESDGEDGCEINLCYFSTNIIVDGKKAVIPYDYIYGYLPEELYEAYSDAPIEYIRIADVFGYDLDMLRKLDLYNAYTDYSDDTGKSSFSIEISEKEIRVLSKKYPIKKGDKKWSPVIKVPELDSKLSFLYNLKKNVFEYWIHMEGDTCVVSSNSDILGKHTELFKYGSGIRADYGLESLLKYLEGVVKYPIREIFIIGGTRIRMKKHSDGEVTVVIY